MPRGAGKTAVWREVQKCLCGGKAGRGKAMAQAFFVLTGILLCAVPLRGPQGRLVHKLPLDFPLKKSRIGTAGTWTFQHKTVGLRTGTVKRSSKL
ncbi:hypothetical protein OA84_00865 [Kaistella solincola]|uniref:Uncharacterized protein n=1 Tax=Kaistella solincola TaxID=510955 RepID=A0ABR4ZU05_9FLAO|nr:hypothetical protein OA84_00865 [Kaistella solincola]